MGRKCSFKDCQSGQIVDGISLNEVSIFRLPNNTPIREKWLSFLKAHGAENIPKYAFVCEKHFTKAQVKKEYKCVDAVGNVLLQHKFQKVKLVQGAVPSVASTTLDKNDDIEQPVLDSFSCNIETNFTTASNEKHGEYAIMNNTIQPVIKSVTTTTLNENIGETSTCNLNEMTAHEPKQSVFFQIFNQPITLRLPDKSWGMHQLDFPIQTISVSQMRKTANETDEPPFVVKQMIFDENLNCKAYIHSKSIEIPTRQIGTVEGLESLIEDFHNMMVCSGGPSVTLYKNVNLRCAYKDMCNKWRHNLCSLKTKGERTCKFCVRVHRAADAHFYRNRKLRMPRLPLSPSTKKKIVLRKAKRVQAQTVHRKRVRLAQVTEELETLSEKEFLKVSLEEVIKKLIIPANQVKRSSINTSPSNNSTGNFLIR